MSPDGLCVIRDPGLSPSLRDLARDVAVGMSPRCHQGGGSVCGVWKPGGSVCIPRKMGSVMPRKRFPWLLLSVTIPKCLTRSSNALLGEACLNPIFQSFRLMFPDVLETCSSSWFSKAGELSVLPAGIILHPKRQQNGAASLPHLGRGLRAGPGVTACPKCQQ